MVAAHWMSPEPMARWRLLRDLLQRHVEAVLLEDAGLAGERQRRKARPAAEADGDLGSSASCRLRQRPMTAAATAGSGEWRCCMEMLHRRAGKPTEATAARRGLSILARGQRVARESPVTREHADRRAARRRRPRAHRRRRRASARARRAGTCRAPIAWRVQPSATARLERRRPRVSATGVSARGRLRRIPRRRHRRNAPGSPRACRTARAGRRARRDTVAQADRFVDVVRDEDDLFRARCCMRRNRPAASRG